MKSAVFYVDGFNFYHAISDLGSDHLKWMSYWALANLLIPRGEVVSDVRLFTAYATHIPHSMVRHRLATKAWKATGHDCIFGEFKKKMVYCKACKRFTLHHEEKQSDVNIALHLLDDCRASRVDVAYVLTTDSDITPAFKLCNTVWPHVDLVSVAPPGRNPCRSFSPFVARELAVKKWQVEASLMPREIFDAHGKLVVTRPSAYDPPPPPTP